jgi:hypothetical protein
MLSITLNLKIMNSIPLMQNTEIEKLLSESGAPCISIILPTHRLSPDRRVDIEFVRKSVIQAKEIIAQKYTTTNFNLEVLNKRLDALVETIDYIHLKDGIGIYLSPRIAQIVAFPFPVIKKVTAGPSFDSRDLLYYKNSVLDYMILNISRKYIHLYKGKGEQIVEIEDGTFPMEYIETYEYSKSKRANSFSYNTQKDFERDKSVLQEVRLIDFLRIADHSLEKYDKENLPLLISGGKKEIADYLKITTHKKKIIGQIPGNYNGDNKLPLLSWKSVQDYLNVTEEQQLNTLSELIGKNKIAIGLEEVWREATEGNGYELVVEKDFEYHAFLINEKNDLRLTKPRNGKKYFFVNNSVERILKIVREKKGKITFTKNGTMSNFNGIALHLRYTSSK